MKIQDCSSHIAAHYARLQETRTVASPQSPAVSYSENSKCRVDRNSPESRRIASLQSPVVRHSEESPLVSESHSRLTIEKQTNIHSDLLNELAAEEAETDKSVNPDCDDSQFEKCLFNRIPEPDIESPNSCSNCLKQKGTSKSVLHANMRDTVRRSAKQKTGHLANISQTAV